MVRVTETELDLRREENGPGYDGERWTGREDT